VKPILLALAAGVALLLASGFWLRRDPGAQRARRLLALYLAALGALAGVHALTPAHLGFLPEHAEVGSYALDLGFCLFLFSAGFFGGILQLYNLADRGLSLRMLIDVKEAGDAAATVDCIAERYSRGRGIGGMYAKRIDGMVSAGLVAEEGERLRLTPRGARAARLFAWLRRVHDAAEGEA
jgi:hypothetical protein